MIPPKQSSIPGIGLLKLVVLVKQPLGLLHAGCNFCLHFMLRGTDFPSGTNPADLFAMFADRGSVFILVSSLPFELM